jgi:ATP-binding cassette subfamily C (CFTR/MRP) protein 1
MMSAVGSFTRIQEFLTSESQKDDRICHKVYSRSYIPQSEHFSRDNNLSEFELVEVKPTTRINISEQMAISVVDGAFGSIDKGQAVLQDINVAVETCSLTMIIGPVGSGKSTLLKTFLGETRVSKGFVYVSSREMSFCDQSA